MYAKIPAMNITTMNLYNQVFIGSYKRFSERSLIRAISGTE